MASHNQYLFFQHLYDQEQSRGERLITLSNTLIALVSIYGSIFVFKENGFVSTRPELIWAYVLGLTLLLLAFLSGVSVYFLRTYDAIIYPERWIKEHFPSGLPPDDEFFHYIIADVARATSHNRRKNKWRAYCFQAAVFFAFAGVATHGLARLTALLPWR